MRKTVGLLVALAFLAAACGNGGGSSDGDVKFLPGDGRGGDVTGDGRSGDTGPKEACTVSQDCPADLPVCDQFSGTCVECKKNGDCTDSDLPYCNPATMKCVQCVMKEHCPSEYQYCLEGKCSDKPCIPGNKSCVGNTVHVCSPDGMEPNWEVQECGGKICVKGQCLECKPKEVSCKGSNVIECSATGQDYKVLEECSGGKDCFGGKCLVCYPGSKQCEGNVSMRCTGDGGGWEFNQDCAEGGLTCYMGACLSPCAGDLKQNTNAGCEFFALDLDNYEDFDSSAASAQYAVIVSNTSKTDPADVTIKQPDGKVLAAVLPPMSLHKFELPPTWGLNGTMKGKNAFQVNSSRPVVVYQFNPLSNKVEVFSNDASVLLPAPAMGSEYYVMAYGFGGAKPQPDAKLPSFFAVVGLSSVPTQVTFTPSVATMAGGDIPALPAGQSHTVELAQGEVLNVESSQGGADLTGSHVTATAAVAVFGGHECPFTSDLCCCDHIEQQLMPVSTWGTHYIVSKFWERWKEKDYVRILASEDGTVVTINPPLVQVPTLAAGKYFTFQTNVNLEITANKPILVGQYLASSYEILGMPKVLDCWSNSDCPSSFTCDSYSGACIGPDCSTSSQCSSGTTCELAFGMGNCAPIGDPAFALAVSEQQFMDSYVFLTPDAYLQDYLNVVAPLNAGKVVLDDMQIPPPSFIPVGSSGYGVYRTKVNDGVHTIWSDKKIGIMVYGYDNDVSYAYPGGMGLAELDF